MPRRPPSSKTLVDDDENENEAPRRSTRASAAKLLAQKQALLTTKNKSDAESSEESDFENDDELMPSPESSSDTSESEAFDSDDCYKKPTKRAAKSKTKTKTAPKKSRLAKIYQPQPVILKSRASTPPEKPAPLSFATKVIKSLKPKKRKSLPMPTPTLSEPKNAPATTLHHSAVRRHDILVPEDNLGVEQRAIILPSSGKNDDGFSDDDDDDDDFIEVERVDIAAERQEIFVQDPVEKRRIEFELKEAIRAKLQVLRRKKDNFHRIHLFLVVANLYNKAKKCVAFVKNHGYSSVLADTKTGALNYLRHMDFSKLITKHNLKNDSDLDPRILKDLVSSKRLEVIGALICENEFDIAMGVFLNLVRCGFLTRIVYAFKALPKGETNVEITDELKKAFIENEYSLPKDFVIKGRRTTAAEKKLKSRAPPKPKKQSRKKTENALEDEEFENENDLDGMTPEKTAFLTKSAVWNEVWDHELGMWIAVDGYKNTVNKPELISQRLDHEVNYVFAMDSAFGFRDISAKYIIDFVYGERRQPRLSEKYIFTLMHLPQITADLYRSILEDDLIRGLLLSQEQPKNIQGYKDHYLYALRDHVKVKEDLYPRNPPVLFLHNRHEVFYKFYVAQVDIGLRWVRKGYEVKEGEKPYKLINGRKRKNSDKIPDKQEVFGPWQLRRYPPPELTPDGIPENEHGNIYMYRPWMLPHDCFHLKVLGMAEQIAQIAQVQFVPAVVGWTFKKAKYFPVIYGGLIFKDDIPLVLEAKQKFFDEGGYSKRRDAKTQLPYIDRDFKKQIVMHTLIVFDEFHQWNNSSINEDDTPAFIKGRSVNHFNKDLSSKLEEIMSTEFEKKEVTQPQPVAAKTRRTRRNRR